MFWFYFVGRGAWFHWFYIWLLNTHVIYVLKIWYKDVVKLNLTQFGKLLFIFSLIFIGKNICEFFWFTHLPWRNMGICYVFFIFSLLWQYLHDQGITHRDLKVKKLFFKVGKFDFHICVCQREKGWEIKHVSINPS